MGSLLRPEFEFHSEKQNTSNVKNVGSAGIWRTLNSAFSAEPNLENEKKCQFDFFDTGA